MFDQRNAQGCVAQGDGETGTGQPTTDDNQIKLLHGDGLAVSYETDQKSNRVARRFAGPWPAVVAVGTGPVLLGLAKLLFLAAPKA